MPVIKSAKKKLRRDRKVEVQNKAQKDALKALIKSARSAKSEKAVQAVFQAADKAVKKHIIHKNKAARIKSVLAKLLHKKEAKAETPKTKKTTKK